jgi:hypothetical protein
VDVYPDYDRDYVQIVHRNGEKTCRITIPMEAKTAEEGKYDRLVDAENFQVLFDRTDVLLETETYHHYVGQVNDRQVSFGLWGYEKEEALQFLK